MFMRVDRCAADLRACRRISLLSIRKTYLPYVEVMMGIHADIHAFSYEHSASIYIRSIPFGVIPSLDIAIKGHRIF